MKGRNKCEKFYYTKSEIRYAFKLKNMHEIKRKTQFLVHNVLDFVLFADYLLQFFFLEPIQIGRLSKVGKKERKSQKIV